MAEQGWYLPRMSRATWSTRRSQAGDETKITRSNGKQGAGIPIRTYRANAPQRCHSITSCTEFQHVPTPWNVEDGTLCAAATRRSIDNCDLQNRVAYSFQTMEVHAWPQGSGALTQQLR